jgi:tuberculosinol/isotuberculosinol synthase
LEVKALSISLAEFENLPTIEAARLVRKTGSLVCVFPINGTRRWFILQQASNPSLEMDGAGYVKAMEQQHIAMYRLFFEHGVDTLLTPIFGPDLLERGKSYLTMAVDGMARLVTQPHFIDFYNIHQVRVRFYGDYAKYLANTPYAFLIDLFEQITERTKEHNRHRLFFGLFANDPAETVAEIGARFYQQQQRLPNKEELIALYYGEPVEPVSFFLGFDRLSAFDMPLIATGNEDLYFTVSPSLDLTGRQLRRILYDHLFTRQSPEPDYEDISPEDLEWMRSYYAVNHEQTIGLGRLNGGVWYPLPCVTWPSQPVLDGMING